MRPRNTIRVADLFDIVMQVPGEGCLELGTVTLGVFETSVPESFKSSREVDYSKLWKDLLQPWFLHRQRVLGLNDLFEVSEIRFKVMAAMPAFGRVVQSTRLICYESLRITPLKELLIGVLEPSGGIINPQSLGPYLRLLPRHIHLSNPYPDQYLYINNHEFVVLACEPSDGVVDGDTDMSLHGHYLDPAYYLHLHPEQETLSLAQGTDLMQGLVLPFFQGWRRPVPMRARFNIAGVDFQTVGASSNFCYVTPFTEIRIVENSMEELMKMLNRKEKAGKNLPTRELETLPPDPENRCCIICDDDYKPKDVIKTLPCCKLSLSPQLPQALHRCLVGAKFTVSSVQNRRRRARQGALTGLIELSYGRQDSFRSQAWSCLWQIAGLGGVSAGQRTSSEGAIPTG